MQVPVLDRDRMCGPFETWLFLAVRDVSGRRDLHVPSRINQTFECRLDCTEAVYRFIERVTEPPYLDLFGLHSHSDQWTIPLL